MRQIRQVQRNGLLFYPVLAKLIDETYGKNRRLSAFGGMDG